MATQTNSFANALNRIDPTQGLVGYIQDVKPYHTKILDVLVEYVYAEQVSVSFAENLVWQIEFSRPSVETEYVCDFNSIWSIAPTRTAIDGLSRRMNVINATAAIEGDANSHSFLVEPQTYEPVPFSVASTYNNRMVFSTEYDIVGKNSSTNTWQVTDPTGALLQSLTVGTFPKSIYIVADTSGVGLGKYTVNAAPTAASGVTTVTTVEDIPTQMAADGKLCVPREQRSFNVVGVTTGINGVWIVSGNVAGLFPPGKKFDIVGNTGVSERTYTTVTAFPSGPNTHITVDAIVSSATVTGSLDFSDLPPWPAGMAVRVAPTSTGDLPTPLALGATYYFQPSAEVGYFTLSTGRYSTRVEEYINLADFGVGEFQLQRVETFVPGTPVTIRNTHRGRNDGDYVVKFVVQEGANERIFVYQPIESTSPISLPYDGTMSLRVLGLSTPTYCPPSRMGDLHTDAYIHETIKFTFEINLSDFVGAAYEENPRRGFGETPYSAHRYSPYGTYVVDVPVALTSGLPPGDSAHTLLPTGIDTQLFGVGCLDETLEYVSKLYSKV